VALFVKNLCNIVSSPSNIGCKNFVFLSPNLHQVFRDFFLQMASTYLLIVQCSEFRAMSVSDLLLS